MANPKIPANSLLLTQFSQFRLKQHRPDSRNFMLVAKGDEINTVWFEDRPLRGYGHFSFDEITGKAAWKKLFNGDKPNSVLSGQGRSLVFETGHFQTRANGTYASKIKLIGDQANQDVITGQWKKSSLLIDSTSDPDDSTNTIVEGLAGLLVVGGGLALYKKIRANRVAEAAEQAVEDANEDVAQAEKNLDNLKFRYDRLEESTVTMREEIDMVETTVKDAQLDLARFEYELTTAQDKERIIFIKGRIDSLQKEIIDQQQWLTKLSGKLERLELQLEDAERAVLQAEKTLNDAKNGLNAAKQLEEVAVDELQASLDDIAAQDNLYDNDVFLENQSLIEADQVNEVDLLSQMIDEDFGQYKSEQIEAVKEAYGDGFTKSMEDDLANIISKGSRKAYSSFVEATCFVPLLATGTKKSALLGSGICTDIEGIDPVVDLYAEEFTIEENMIFKGSHIFTKFRSDLAEIGYEAEVAELTEFVAGPEFAGEAGELIGAFTEGTLVAEEAVGALDIASIGLGGEAFVDGLALEVGGDALLGEIALDILEIAVIF